MKKTSKKPIKSGKNEKILFFLNKNKGKTATTRKDLKNKDIEVLASKKEFTDAIRRNKARRRIKEAYRTVMRNLPDKRKGNQSSLKISAKIGTLQAPFEEIKEIIKKEIDNNHV